MSTDVAVDKDDQLGYTIKFIRAFEACNASGISNCLLGYPHLASLIPNRYAFDGNTTAR